MMGSPDSDRTRRAVLAGAAATALAPSLAEAASAPAPRDVVRNPAFKPWSRVAFPKALPQDQMVNLPGGRETTFGAWLGGAPAVVVVWATWCAPCMSEKAHQAFLTRRLAATYTRTRIKMLQAFDNVGVDEGMKALERVNAKGLDVAAASVPLEQSLIGLFGPSTAQTTRIAIPSELLLAADGSEIGRARGQLAGVSGQSYWMDITTYQFLVSLEHLMKG